jgi:hypothetical protein
MKLVRIRRVWTEIITVNIRSYIERANLLGGPILNIVVVVVAVAVVAVVVVVLVVKLSLYRPGEGLSAPRI